MVRTKAGVGEERRAASRCPQRVFGSLRPLREIRTGVRNIAAVCGGWNSQNQETGRPHPSPDLAPACRARIQSFGARVPDQGIPRGPRALNTLAEIFGHL